MEEEMKKSRRDYAKGVLLDGDVPQDPMTLLLEWYQSAVTIGAPDANAMSLSTLDLEGYPTSRIVLLRDASSRGVSFFTNYDSDKGQEIAANPKASVQFYWHELERQVRIRGVITKLPEAESDSYFKSRPRESQIGAWASEQSRVIESRAVLDRSYQEYVEKFKNEIEVPRPRHWGGYLLKPNTFEFWQGRPSRLHDRMRCVLKGQVWLWQRISP